MSENIENSNDTSILTVKDTTDFNEAKVEINRILNRVEENLNEDLVNKYIVVIKEQLDKLNRPEIDSVIVFTVKKHLEQTLTVSESYKKNQSGADKISVMGDISVIKDLFQNIYNCHTNFHHVLKGHLGDAYEELTNELHRFRKDRNIYENFKAEDFYSNAVNKYLKLERKYRKYFYRTILIVFILTILLFLFKSYLLQEPFKLDTTEIWTLKGSVILVGITLISYFLKQSVHYQKLADQNYQTQIELQVYPEYIKSIPTQEAALIRKELALKYFGREIDGAAHKDMSNLISDQMKNTTEMVKATTEAIKNLKG